MYLKTSRHFWLGTVFVSSDFSLVSICTGRTFDLLVSAIRANVVSEETTHGRSLLHLLQQIPSTMPQHRRSWRPSLRAQPAAPPRPFDDATGSRPGARGTVGNHCQSHRGSGRAVSLAVLRRETRFAKARLLTPPPAAPVLQLVPRGGAGTRTKSGNRIFALNSNQPNPSRQGSALRLPQAG